MMKFTNQNGMVLQWGNLLTKDEEFLIMTVK
jgi:hypothetical protein